MLGNSLSPSPSELAHIQHIFTGQEWSALPSSFQKRSSEFLPKAYDTATKKSTAASHQCRCRPAYAVLPPSATGGDLAQCVTPPPCQGMHCLLSWPGFMLCRVAESAALQWPHDASSTALQACLHRASQEAFSSFTKQGERTVQLSETSLFIFSPFNFPAFSILARFVRMTALSKCQKTINTAILSLAKTHMTFQISRWCCD